ncbi:MAG: ATP-dependent DNA ligase [Gaiellaceae bacterium]
MQLATLVEASETTAATRKRTEKIEALASVLRTVDPSEAAIAVGYLRGRPRQGKVGAGWATLKAVNVDPSPKPSLTLVEVDAALGRLSEMSGAGVESRRRDELSALLSRATDSEQRFLRLLLLGELRQGALEGIVTDAVAKGAGVPQTVLRRAAMLTGDLGHTAQIALEKGEGGLRALGLELLRPLKPMLAASAETVEAAIDELGEAFVEWKLDGARIQVHRSGQDVRIFTRNLNDVTARLPEVVAAALELPADSVVLDGEVMALGEGERPVPFQDSMSRFAQDTGHVSQMAAFYFDCLHLDGADLIDEPFRSRREALEGVVGGAVTPGRAIADRRQARALLEEAINAGHEGVMVKDLDAAYDAGRRGKAWRKVKPVVTVDLVVLAADWGHGRREGWLSNLHLGARGTDGGLVMVGKTFKGMTDELLRWQTAELLARELERERITVRVRQELVVEIALDGVQRSTRYPGGVALRFARVKRYRSDKTPDEATTIEELRALLRSS